MPADDLCFLTIGQMGDLLRRREISPTTLVEAHLARIRRLDAAYATYITVMADEARAEAQAAEAEIGNGRVRGPLHGVPIGLKDLFWTRGVRTTGGSAVLADFVPEEDATAVARLREAGAIIIGKQNLHEFARGATSTNPHFGACRNPWDPSRVPGGSSGGSAAATVAGLCAGALGSDTGGSVRTPPALCGVVGLKPTYGRVSRYGVIELSWTLDHVGPIARTVEDAALLLNAIAGYDPRDLASAREPVPDFAALDGNVRGLRAGIPREVLDEPMEDDVRRLFLAAIGVLRDAGLAIDEVSLPEATQAPSIIPLIANAEATHVHAEWLAQKPEGYGTDVRERLELGKLILATDYVGAQRKRLTIAAAVNRAFEHVDVLLTPTVGAVAPVIGATRLRLGDKEFDLMTGLSHTTQIYNFTGGPAISVPCGFTPAGLPAGLQIGAPMWHEVTVLRVAKAYESRTNWWQRRPPEP